MHSTTPGVSIIIPVYNRAHLVGRAIRSVLTAATREDEVMVIDDGSTDDTESVVRAFGDAVRYERIRNRGCGGARNYALGLVARPLVAFLDSDDEWAPDKLTLQRAVMENHPDVVLCFCNLQCRYQDGTVLHDLLSVWRRDANVGSAEAPAHLSGRLGPGVPFSSIAPLPPNRTDFMVHVGNLYRWLMEVLYVTSSAAMVRRALAGMRLRFAEDIPVMDGWECFARVAAIGPVAYLDCELATQVAHSGPRLIDKDPTGQITTRIKVLQRLWGADESFQKTHGEHYRHILRTQQRLRARLLIANGETREAAQELDRMGGGPWLYRLLTMMPGPLVRRLLSMRRQLRGSQD